MHAFRVLLAFFVMTLNAQAGSLHFQGGNSANDADRVKIVIDDPSSDSPGPPADIGDSDFTIEMWVRSGPGNDQGAVECTAYSFIWGNIILDRDRYEQGRSFGLSLTDGRVTFSVQVADYASATVCGTTDLRDGRWHHIAVQRRYSDGRLWVYVDGRQEASAYGPRGDLSYPDGGRCKAPDICAASDHFLVIGAEKHDLAAGFSGWIDEVRLSNSLRYPGSEMPAAPFQADGHTLALYRFDEGEGDTIADSATGAASQGKRLYGVGGGAAPGPEWSADSPFIPHPE